MKLGLSTLGLSVSGGRASSHPRNLPGDYDRIHRLELEIAQLKSLVSKQISYDGSTVLADSSPSDLRPTLDVRKTAGCEARPLLQEFQDANQDEVELRFWKGKEFKTRYFGPYNATLAFCELTGLCPFMKETAEEWLRPLHIHDRKDRKKRKEDRDVRFLKPELELEALLPPKEETDELVNVYLDQFEQVHRIVHIPTFRKQYATFWDPTVPRPASSTVLVLAMISISSCLHGGSNPGKFIGLVSNSHHLAVKWIMACDEWSEKQSQKHRRLVHFQIACLLYLAKRVNTVKKKRFWKGSAALVQDAIGVGLHREPTRMNDKITVYNQEMRRRLWATMQEFDLQASFDYGLPTILSTLHYDVAPPRNIDDEEFDEESRVLPPSQPVSTYTYTSYQHLSRQSVALRLDLSRLMTGSPEDIDYDRIIRYTNDVTAEIDTLPSWDLSDPRDPAKQRQGKKPLLAYTLLHIQLRQYIIALHQPYLKLRKTNSKYQYSEILYYNAARDMVMLHDKLHQDGIRTLNFFREDVLSLCINLCNITMLQPRGTFTCADNSFFAYRFTDCRISLGSTNMIMINSQVTIRLLEKCIAIKEDRILRCGNNEPWGYSIMCSALGLLEAHLAIKTSEAAKAASAERFIALHYRLLSMQEPAVGGGTATGALAGVGIATLGIGGLPRPATPAPTMETERGRAGSMMPPPSRERTRSITPFQFTSSSQCGCSLDAPATPWWTTGGEFTIPPNPDHSLEALGIDLSEIWGENWDLFGTQMAMG
jgi:hypothetical protein